MAKTLTSIYTDYYGRNVYVTRETEQHIDVLLQNDNGSIILIAEISKETYDSNHNYFIFGMYTSSDYTPCHHEAYIKTINEALTNYFKKEGK